MFFSGCAVFEEKDESEWTVKEFYDYAKDFHDRGQWQSAITYYEKLKSYFPYGVYAEKSYLELAYSYNQFGEPESARLELEEFIRIYPKHKFLSYAYHLKALAIDSINQSWLDAHITDPANRDVKSTKEAYKAYSQLIERFPNSKYVPNAKKRIVVLFNTISRNEYLVAKYYYERKAYLAAASRVKFVLENYSGAKVTLASLKIMRNSYNKLGMQQHAKDTQQIIDSNFK
jgi:outer membrane protein assembly factor BamD